MLDVGTGNGALLFKLDKKGWIERGGSLKGIDYSQASINLVKRIQANKEGSQILFEFQNAFDLVDEGVYDLIYDKGTFDVVYMNPDLSNKDYAKAMYHRLSKTNPKACFILTSCNLTSQEMDTIFTGEGLFKRECEIKGYR